MRPRILFTAVATASALVILGMGCSSSKPNANPPAATQTGRITDGQIANIALTAHQIDMERGELVLGKTQSREVEQFAKSMVADHTAGKQEAMDAGRRLNLRPEESDLARSLKSQADRTAVRLRELRGHAFDRAYIDEEVNYHQSLLDALDHTLTPGASSAELKTLLANTRSTVQRHLDHAKHLQNTLEKPR